MNGTKKTIIAIATPPAVGAIAIIRISGIDAFSAAKKVFPRLDKEKPRFMTYGKLTAGEINDDVTAVYYKAPHSYTGEDGVEIFCHGSYALANEIVTFMIDNCGVVLAERGEFTARAVANGKIDLTQAEGVLDIINSETQAEMRGAYSLVCGNLARRVESIQRMIIQTRVGVEAALDFPEEDIERITADSVKTELYSIKKEIDAFLSSYRDGRIIRDGVKVALVGKPNAGKSMLMNALLGYERAIVTDEKGTTRDTLTESYIYNGLRFLVTDTAGIREAESLPEKMGIERAVNAAKESDVIVIVTENPNDDEAIAEFENSDNVIICENKLDIKEKVLPCSVGISALKGDGIEELKKEIYAFCSDVSLSSACINNERQFSLVKGASAAIERAIENIRPEMLELTGADLDEAFTILGRITGISGSDALAEEIFSKFCVGK